MDRFINRVLRRHGDRYLILVNNERIGEVIRFGNASWVAQSEHLRDEHVPEVTPVIGSTPLEVAASFCHRAEKVINDFFVIVEANPEPDDPSNLYYVDIAARGSGRLLDSFTSSDGYGAVAAAREAQAHTLEERLGEYGIEWEREQEDRRLNR